MRRILFLILLMTGLAYALPQGIETAISHSGIPKKDISIYIKEAGDSGSLVASLNARQTRTPASVIKVLTTYAAVLKLGFNYRWPTQFYKRGRLKNGTLHGDLLIKGFGDPTLDTDDLKDIVVRIKAKGIEKITGNIVIDRSYFKVGNKNSSKFDENPYSPYNAMPDAMMFNERVSTICVIPNKNDVHKKYPDGSFVIHNRLQRVNKPCRGRYSWPQVKIDDSKAVPEVWLKGKISKRCGNRNICRVVTQPYKSFYYGLKDALKHAGIAIQGRLKLQKIPKDAQILFTHYSERLEKIISKTAKKSNNLYARHLLLFLGAKVYGAPATLSKGRRAVLNILKEHDALSGGTLYIDNGSGLSRTAKLNTKILATMLDNAYERYGKRWMNTLSIAGVDGTIKKRFRGTIVRKRAWMKTGTLKRVKNIAGYVKSKERRLYTVVIIVNTKKGRWKAAKLQNEIIKWLVSYKREEHGKHLLSETGQKGIETDSYFIQTGSFAYKPSSTYLTKITQKGYPYKVVHQGEYKVMIGPYENENRAREVLSEIRSSFAPHAFFVSLP